MVEVLSVGEFQRDDRRSQGLHDIPENPLKWLSLENKRYLEKRFHQTLAERCPKRSPIQEQEQKQYKDSCLEVKLTSTPDQPETPVLVIHIIGKEKEFRIYQKDVEEWQETFPGVDILGDLKRCRQWNVDNPKNRKTPTGNRKHISAWLGRSQDRSKPTGLQPQKGFTPREKIIALLDEAQLRIER